MNHLAPLVALSSLLASTLLSTTVLAAPNNLGYPGDGSDAPAPTTNETPRIFPAQTPSQDQVDTSTSAKAQPEPWEKRRLALYAHLAPIGGPAGNAGASVEFSPIPLVALEAGVGMGLSGPQVAVNTWLRPLRSGTSAVLIGAGLSTGNYAPLALEASSASVVSKREAEMMKSIGWFPAYWGNVEIAGEWAFAGGFRLRPYGGFSRLLNTSALSTPFPISKQDAPSKFILPFFGLQLGASFGL